MPTGKPQPRRRGDSAWAMPCRPEPTSSPLCLGPTSIRSAFHSAGRSATSASARWSWWVEPAAGSVAAPSVTGFTSDGNNTYSWTLSGSLGNNKYVFAIATTGSSFGTPAAPRSPTPTVPASAARSRPAAVRSHRATVWPVPRSTSSSTSCLVTQNRMERPTQLTKSWRSR